MDGLVALSYNIHWAVGLDGKYDLGRIASVLAKHRPHLIGLQEVHKQTELYPEDQAEEIASLYSAAIGQPVYSHFFGVCRGHPKNQGSKGLYGIAVLSLFPIQATRDVTYDAHGNSNSHEPRGVTAVLVEPLHGKKLWFTTTHMGCDLTGTEQLQSAPQLCTLAESLGISGVPVIICGDFNVLSFTQTIRHICSRGWVDVWRALRRRAFFAGRSVRLMRIDYFFISPQRHGSSLQAKSIIVDQSTSASDHFPVVTRFFFS
eukprot:TRINITY_DN95926_c0_g1_i1.p1 TRINITY_DN95926_c0_g1~~TRINITY_DN95926_c0_g1_i1.p1  ORF type:complete len:269 (-),score=33.24 TRINITY_DN95926_c0_g1_i1:11-790(-)